MRARGRLLRTEEKITFLDDDLRGWGGILNSFLPWSWIIANLIAEFTFTGFSANKLPSGTLQGGQSLGAKWRRFYCSLNG